MSNVAKVERNYGIERSIGEIIYNPTTKAVVANVNGGIFGKLSLTLKRDDAGGYDLLKPYKDGSGNEQVVKLGKLFPVKDKRGNLVDGLSKGTLPLLKQWDAELKKEVNSSKDCLVITTHKLKKNEAMGDSGWLKIGYITGQYAIEKKDTTSNYQSQPDYSGHDIPDIDINDDEIPF